MYRITERFWPSFCVLLNARRHRPQREPKPLGCYRILRPHSLQIQIDSSINGKRTMLVECLTIHFDQIYQPKVAISLDQVALDFLHAGHL